MIGETNPYGPAPGMALWPYPLGCSGWRLCFKILKMKSSDYIKKFDRVNLVDGDWDLKLASKRASELEHESRILLGTRVCQAHGVEFKPFSFVGSKRFRALILPHPSGRSRSWNLEGSVDRARLLVEAFTAPTQERKTDDE